MAAQAVTIVRRIISLTEHRGGGGGGGEGGGGISRTLSPKRVFSHPGQFQKPLRGWGGLSTGPGQSFKHNY